MASMIIGIVSQKGGVSKTTTSVNLAGELVNLGYRVLLVDSDPQGSAAAWQGAGEGEGWPSVISMTEPNLHRPGQLPSIAEAYDHVVIDGPPRHGGLTRSILMASELAVVPLIPSAVDLRAIGETMELIQDAQTFNTELQAAILITKKMSGTVLGREIREALEEPPYGEFPVLETEISQREIMKKLPIEGDLIHLYAPNSPSAREFRQLAEEILDYAND